MIVVVVLLAVVLTGCAAFQTTPAQDFARRAWDSCPHAANNALEYIEPSGRIHWRWVNSPSGTQEHIACVTEYYRTYPQPK